jgi:hypothetical protein
MVCRSANDGMPGACGKPGHFWWLRVERCCGSCVSPRDNQSSLHISTPGFSTSCGRRGGVQTVDKWHVSVDKPSHLGKGQDCRLLSGGFSRTRRMWQTAQLDAHALSLSPTSSAQSLVLHRKPLPSSAAGRSITGVLPQLMREPSHTSRDPFSASTSPQALQRLLLLDTCEGDSDKVSLLPNRAVCRDHRDAG